MNNNNKNNNMNMNKNMNENNSKETKNSIIEMEITDDNTFLDKNSSEITDKMHLLYKSIVLFSNLCCTTYSEFKDLIKLLYKRHEYVQKKENVDTMEKGENNE